MHHFSNDFFQILVIRSKCWGWGTDGPGGAKKFQGAAAPYFPCLCWATTMDLFLGSKDATARHHIGCGTEAS